MDYYKLLQIERNASLDNIKKSYRTLAKKHHPDKGGDQEIFKQEISAYVKRKAVLDSNIQLAYSLILGQFSELLKNKLKAYINFLSIRRIYR